MKIVTNSKVAVVGYGVEGKSVANYAKGHGAEVLVCDKNIQNKPGDFKFQTGNNYLDGLDDYDLIFRSPSVNPKFLSKYGDKVTSITNYFLENSTSINIGITGTKGKGTTSTLIDKIIRNSGRKSWLLGNVGKPAMDSLDEINNTEQAFAVYEMSSFQLWDCRTSPHIAVVLMITEDHLNVHDSLDDYRSAKANIVKGSGAEDFVIYYMDNEFSKSIAESSSAQKLPFPADNFAHVKDQKIYFSDQEICSIQDVKLVGEHNIQNILAAVNVAKILDIENSVIRETIASYTNLSLRLELIREKDGVKYYNDSYSSNPSATLAAVKSFQGKRILIVGGYDRGVSFQDLSSYLHDNESDIKTIIYGQNKHKVKAFFDDNSYGNYLVAEDDLKTVTATIKDVLSDEKVVIFSPGSASFDMFKDFSDRGAQFSNIINSL
jgi:UDP-N-acetylmuramoylalanine--D-glutamate ligase